MGDLVVRLQPRAPREEVVGERDGRLVVRVTAAPVEGRANGALCRLIARRLRIAPRRVAVVSGQTSRDKRVRVDGVASADLRRRLQSQSR